METETKAPQVEVLGGVVPYLAVTNAAEAAEFYKKAFGAQEVLRMPPDDKGRYLHIHLYVNGGSIMLADPFPDHGHPHVAPQGFTLHMKVDDVDFWWQRAVDAGAEIVLPLQKMFWGDRYGQLRDPFGNLWSMGQPAAEEEKAAMEKYVDGYVLPVPKKNMDDYRKMAELGRQVWLEHGALDYFECVAEDVKPGKHTSFPQAVKLKEGETVVFAWITFKSRAHRDEVNTAVMKDPRMNGYDPKKMPFDGKRMIFGGFETFVST